MRPAEVDAFGAHLALLPPCAQNPLLLCVCLTPSLYHVVISQDAGWERSMLLNLKGQRLSPSSSKNELEDLGQMTSFLWATSGFHHKTIWNNAVSLRIINLQLHTVDFYCNGRLCVSYGWGWNANSRQPLQEKTALLGWKSNGLKTTALQCDQYCNRGVYQLLGDPRRGKCSLRPWASQENLLLTVCSFQVPNLRTSVYHLHKHDLGKRRGSQHLFGTDYMPGNKHIQSHFLLLLSIHHCPFFMYCSYCSWY